MSSVNNNYSTPDMGYRISRSLLLASSHPLFRTFSSLAGNSFIGFVIHFIRTAKGHQAVIELLESYENLEARRTRDQGGQLFDFGFLWEQLGLPRRL